METKPFDLQVLETQQAVVDLLNRSGLPISVVGLILREITAQVNVQEQQTIEKQRQEYEAAKKKADTEAKKGAN